MPDPSKGNGPRQCVPNRPPHDGREDHRADEKNVQEYGRGGGSGEPTDRVQNTRQQCGEGDEQDIGECDPTVENREVKPLVPLKPRGHRQHEPRHRDHRNHGKDDQNARQTCKRVIGKLRRVLVAFDLFGEHRHKGHVERPFGKEPTEHVGQGKRD